MVRWGWRKESEVEPGGVFSDRATAVLLYPIKDRFYGSLRSTNRPSVSLAPHPWRHMVVTHRCVSPCGNGGFMHFTIKRKGRKRAGRVKRDRERERANGFARTCKRKPWNRDEHNQRHIKLFARQTWLNIPFSLFFPSSPPPYLSTGIHNATHQANARSISRTEREGTATAV